MLMMGFKTRNPRELLVWVQFLIHLEINDKIDRIDKYENYHIE